ncbi:MAG: hypothetical protein FWC50_01820 [Planctomycetaceae bacterium]|nr:hypothetical protein [Planctomycetaceae bacterium]
MNNPIQITLITEDRGHEAFLKALILRIASEFNFSLGSVRLFPRSVRGGHGKVLSELKEFVEEIARFKQSLPDLIVAASDSNCVGFNTRCKAMQECVESVKDRVVFAVPDPHVERWMLLDSHAFKKVFGVGCRLPDNKCDKDRYKSLLADAFSKTEVEPLFSGFEYSENLIQEMDLDKIKDNSLKRLIDDLKNKFRIWKKELF